MFFTIFKTVDRLRYRIGESCYSLLKAPLPLRGIVLLIFNGVFWIVFGQFILPLSVVMGPLPLVLIIFSLIFVAFSFLNNMIGRSWLLNRLNNGSLEDQDRLDRTWDYPDNQKGIMAALNCRLAAEQRRSIVANLPPHLKKDRSVFLAALARDGSLIQYADPILQADEDIALAAVKNAAFECVQEYLPDKLKKNKKILLAAVRHDGEAIRFVPEHWRTELEFLMPAVRYFATPITYVKDALDMNIQDHREVMQVVVKKGGWAIEYVKKSLNLERDRGVILDAVRHDGNALQHVIHLLDIHQDTDIILAAVENNGEAFLYVRDLLKIEHESHRAIMLAAVRKNGHNIRYIRDALNMAIESHREIALAAVNHNGFAIRHIKHLLQIPRDMEIVLAAANKDPERIIKFIDMFKEDASTQSRVYILSVLQEDPQIAALIQQYEDSQQGTASSTKARLR